MYWLHMHHAGITIHVQVSVYLPSSLRVTCLTSVVMLRVEQLGMLLHSSSFNHLTQK
jgi:hypothetical protein